MYSFGYRAGSRSCSTALAQASAPFETGWMGQD